jgi:serine/threonine protein kinase
VLGQGCQNPICYTEAKIVDFGFSTFIVNNQKLTRSCGTPHYMAKELYQKLPYNGYKTDVWALGVVLFYLASGKLIVDPGKFKSVL